MLSMQQYLEVINHIQYVRQLVWLVDKIQDTGQNCATHTSQNSYASCRGAIMLSMQYRAFMLGLRWNFLSLAKILQPIRTIQDWILVKPWPRGGTMERWDFDLMPNTITMCYRLWKSLLAPIRLPSMKTRQILSPVPKNLNSTYYFIDLSTDYLRPSRQIQTIFSHVTRSREKKTDFNSVKSRIPLYK